MCNFKKANLSIQIPIDEFITLKEFTEPKIQNRIGEQVIFYKIAKA